ncbi:MAG: hypothetical protein CGW95_01165 [Phenylobacterium zucineum]|nr:MAG: hypothetical protein CGW95_01165 [Phenylobacterium zucineum]
MRLRLVTDAASEPVTVSELMPFIRVDIDPADGVMTALIAAARRRVEKETGLALMTQTWVAVLDRWPDTVAPDYRNAGLAPGAGLSGWWNGVQQGPQSLIVPNGIIEIPKRPFLSVTQIQTRDVMTNFSTLDSSTYYTEVSDYMGRIARKPGAVWPPVPANMLGCIEITFTCGFGAAAANVPDDLKTAIKMLASHWHEHREPVLEGQLNIMPHHVQSILNSWQSLRLR